MAHISDNDLERYCLGMLVKDAGLVRVEEHLLVCYGCTARAAEMRAYIDAVRVAIIAGGYDLRAA